MIQPLPSVEEPNAPQESDTDCVEKQEEQMGIFQVIDKLEEVVDALLNTKSAASSSTLQQNLKAKNSKKLNQCTICTKSFTKLEAVPRVQREEDQVRLVAPTQMALCLRPCLLPTLKGESCYTPSEPSMTRKPQ